MRNHNRRSLNPLGLSIVLGLCLLTLAPRAGVAADRINSSYISVSPGSSSIIWVAKDARLFEKHGLDATVIFISGSVRGIQAILAGEIPIGEGGGPGLTSARLAGGDVIAIAGNVNVLPYYLVAQPGIKRPEELKGKIGGNHIRAYVEAIHFYKTRKEETIKISQKYSRLDDRKAQEETWQWHTRYIPDAPYPPLEGYQLILQDLTATNPKAAQANAKDYIDARFVKELEDSGFIKKLYGK